MIAMVIREDGDGHGKDGGISRSYKVIVIFTDVKQLLRLFFLLLLVIVITGTMALLLFVSVFCVFRSIDASFSLFGC